MSNELKKSNVVITGADGFIGSHLTESLVKLGCNVTAFTMYNSLNSWGWLDTIDKKIIDNTKVISGDIRDQRSVNNLCHKADYIFHLASLIAIPYSYESPYSYLQTNALGTLNVLEYCREKGIKQLIHTSTSEVYGDFNKIPIDETTPVIAKSPYSATKIAADQLAYAYYSSYDIPVSIIRPFNTFG
ncbi:MAG: GDP-mannose 4,6-dehydratase, partial [Gammaproteobacteria bacterium]|nr:GDP-mannose 4,6-dehydratase [Gammaproteobacteria bacterium]